MFKKISFFFIMLLSVAVGQVNGQTKTHWEVNSEGTGSLSLKITGKLYIDGEYIENENIEIGVFDQDGICRGAKLPAFRGNTQEWIYQIQVKGYEGLNYTFRLFDHETENELDYVYSGETIYYESNGSIGALSDPYSISFSTPVTEFTSPVDTEVILQESGKWFSIDGTQLFEAPLERGAYIRDGKKYIIIED